jgi:hypothetical protein
MSANDTQLPRKSRGKMSRRPAPPAPVAQAGRIGYGFQKPIPLDVSSAEENIRPVVTAFEGGRAVVEVEIAFRFFRAVAGFATVLPGPLRLVQTQTGVRAGRKDPGDGGVAVGAGFVAHKSSACNLWRRKPRPAPGGAGIEQQSNGSSGEGQRRRGQPAQAFHGGKAHQGFG